MIGIFGGTARLGVLPSGFAGGPFRGIPAVYDEEEEIEVHTPQWWAEEELGLEHPSEEEEEPAEGDDNQEPSGK